MFFKTAFSKNHQTLASITYVCMRPIREYRLSTFGRGLHGMAHMNTTIHFKIEETVSVSGVSLKL
jgi:hypothetical protein